MRLQLKQLRNNNIIYICIFFLILPSCATHKQKEFSRSESSVNAESYDTDLMEKNEQQRKAKISLQEATLSEMQSYLTSLFLFIRNDMQF